MKLAVVSLEGKSSRNILKEAKKYFETTDSINLRDIEIHSGKDSDVFHKGKSLGEYDCVYVRGSHEYLLPQKSLSKVLLGKTYLPLHPNSFLLCHNKFLTMLELQKNGISIPVTYLAATTEGAKKILEQVNYPIIFKLPAGTHGKGVMFADSISSARSMLDTLDVVKQPYIIQEYIETDATDIRAIVAGDRVIAAMKRKASKNELRANIHMGGKGVSYELDYDAEQTAIRAAKVVGADVCAVDMLEGNKIAVIEINLSPGLIGITQATKMNVANEIAKCLHDRTVLFNENKKTRESSKIMDTLDSKTIVTNLDIKAGVIKLPEVVAKSAGFSPADEVQISIRKGNLQIKKVEEKEKE